MLRTLFFLKQKKGKCAFACAIFFAEKVIRSCANDFLAPYKCATLNALREVKEIVNNIFLGSYTTLRKARQIFSYIWMGHTSCILFVKKREKKRKADVKKV